MQAPSLSSVIVMVLFLAALGAALDKFILSRRLDSWRQKIADLYEKLNTPQAKGLLADVHQLFPKDGVTFESVRPRNKKTVRIIHVFKAPGWLVFAK